jgi:hypothetical protein
MAIVVNEQLKRNSIFFWYGVLNFVLLFICVGFSLFDDTQVLGKNAWLLPMKYYLSIGIFIWSMGWYLYYLNNTLQRNVLIWGFLITTFIQTSLILLQSYRGESSFYNNNTPFDKLVVGFQTVNNIVFFLLMLATTYLFYFQKKNAVSQHFTWGIRMGMIIFLVGIFLGVFILIQNYYASSVNNVFLENVGISKQKHGNFNIPFFLGIHALQIIPLLSYYFFQNKRQVINFTLLYFILMVVFFLMAVLNLKIF